MRAARTTTRVPGRLVLAGLLGLALAAAGCGDDEPEGTSAPTATATATPAVDNTDTSTKPTVEVPPGEPPTELVTEDIVEGKGRPARRGDTLTMHYVGVSHSTGTQFDASWDRGEPFEFELGAGRVIAGWDQGIEGMKRGGRRLLVIPPDLGYGSAGAPPDIAPDETLVFVVDLVDIE